MPIVATRKYLLSCVEDYWLTSKISHNKLPLFHFFFTSCFSITDRLAHHSKLFCTFYKKTNYNFIKVKIWVLSHVIATLVKHNIFEGKTKHFVPLKAYGLDLIPTIWANVVINGTLVTEIIN
jgi:hypothetical protein